MLHKCIIPSALLVLALAAPSTALAEPASSFVVEEPAPAVTSQDLRSPDVRDAAAGVVAATAAQDLRSPDVRDIASGYVQPTEPVPAVQTSSADDGFEWASAGIGAAAMLAIVLALGAAVALVVPRRRMRTPLVH